jgi:hypothetical protein
VSSGRLARVRARLLDRELSPSEMTASVDQSRVRLSVAPGDHLLGGGTGSSTRSQLWWLKTTL